jgi:hypothetical protein
MVAVPAAVHMHAAATMHAATMVHATTVVNAAVMHAAMSTMSAAVAASMPPAVRGEDRRRDEQASGDCRSEGEFT